MSEIIRCKRCNKILTSKESIERGYGRQCYRLVQIQKPDISDEVQFLKCEVSFLKRQLKELKSNGLVSIRDGIERIKEDEHRPERNEFKIQFNVVIKELKVKLEVNPGEIFDYHKILNPIEPRTEIEEPPIIEKIELLN